MVRRPHDCETFELHSHMLLSYMNNKPLMMELVSDSKPYSSAEIFFFCLGGSSNFIPACFLRNFLKPLTAASAVPDMQRVSLKPLNMPKPYTLNPEP